MSDETNCYGEPYAPTGPIEWASMLFAMAVLMLMFLVLGQAWEMIPPSWVLFILDFVPEQS